MTPEVTPEQMARLNRQVETAIPLAHAAGIRLEAGTGNLLLARAPLALNGNPHGSVFGGSLYVVALVAGYAQAVLLLDQAGIDATVVIRHAEADYRRALHGDIVACVQPLAADTRTRFVDAASRHGRGRLKLTVSITDGRIKAFDLHARFAALAPRDGTTAAAEPH